MSWLASLFSVSWLAWASSLLLIVWALLHVPELRSKNVDHLGPRWGLWRDTVMLFALGVIDLTYAVKSHIEVAKIQDVVGPRHMTNDQRATFIAALKDFSKPTERVWIIINTAGTPRARDEQVSFGHEIEAALDEVGWPYREIAGPTQPAGVGVELSLPPTTPELQAQIMQTQDVRSYSPLGLMDAFQRSGLAFQLKPDPPPDQIIRVYVWRQL